jgi:hypothetical protein
MTTRDYSKLEDAYGSAHKIPDLLKMAALYPVCKWDSEPYYSLWSSLYHQGDIYSASIVSVPQLIEIASLAPAERIQDSYHLALSIIIAKEIKFQGKFDIYADADYISSVKRIRDVGNKLLDATGDPSWKRVALSGIAASTGDYRLASFIIDSEIELICPHCEEQL